MGDATEPPRPPSLSSKRVRPNSRELLLPPKQITFDKEDEPQINIHEFYHPVDRIRKSRVYRGKPPTKSSNELNSKPTTPAKTQHNKLNEGEPSNQINPLEELFVPQSAEVTKPAHLVIVNNIRGRKRETRLRVAEANDLLQIDVPETLETDSLAELNCPKTPLEPIISPHSTITYSRTLRAVWGSKSHSTKPVDNALPTPQSIDISREHLSTFQGDVEAKQIVSEMQVIKSILLREQAIEQINRLVALADASTLELHNVTAPKLSRRKSISRNDDIIEEKQSIALQKQKDALISKLERQVSTAVRDLEKTVPRYRQTTIDVVASIEAWKRSFEVYGAKTTNRPLRVQSFQYQGINYLEKMSYDLAPTFEGVALVSVLGDVNTSYHPLLLPQDSAEALHLELKLPFPWPKPTRSETFMTDTSLPQLISIPPGLREKLCHVLSKLGPFEVGAALNTSITIRNATCAIYAEISRQAAIVQTADAALNTHTPYDPFDTIRQFPTVADAFGQILDTNEDEMTKRRQSLRNRQEDTNRENVCFAHAVTTRPLRVNVTQLEELLARKNTKFVIENEAKGHLGHVLHRKKVNRSPDPVQTSALKIQMQFRQHKFRLSLFVTMKRFSRRINGAATDIQRIYRGHRAKSTAGQVHLQYIAEAHYYHFNARYIQRWFLKHRAKQVEEKLRKASILVTSPVIQEAKSPNQTDLYREAGRRRRIERDLLAAQKRNEQAILLAQQMRGCMIIQTCFRHYTKRRANRLLVVARQFARESNAATHIQKLVRCFLAKKLAKRLHQQKQMNTVNYSSTLIQSVYRGHRVRQRLSLAAVLAIKSPHKNRLPVVLKPAVVKAAPTRPRQRRSNVSVPKPLQSPRDKLPCINRRNSGTTWEQLRLKEPRIGDQL